MKPIQVAAEGMPKNKDPEAASPISKVLPVDKVQRLASELAHAVDEWSTQADIQFSAIVFPASSGRGLYFRNESLGKRIEAQDLLLETIEAYKKGNRQFCALPDFSRDVEGEIAAFKAPMARR